EAIAVEGLDCINYPGVQLATLLVKQTAVGHLMSQGVLESVLDIWVKAGLVDEFSALQIVQLTRQALVRHVGDRGEQRKRNVLADDRGGLKQAFVLRGKPVDASRQNHLHCGGDLYRLDRLCLAVLSTLPRQYPFLPYGAGGVLPQHDILPPSSP